MKKFTLENPDNNLVNQSIIEHEDSSAEFLEIFSTIANTEYLKKFYVPPVVSRCGGESEAELWGMGPIGLEEKIKRSPDADFSKSFKRLERGPRFHQIFILGPIGRGKTTFIHYELSHGLQKRLPNILLRPVFADLLECENDFSILKGRCQDRVHKIVFGEYKALGVTETECNYHTYRLKL